HEVARERRLGYAFLAPLTLLLLGLAVFPGLYAYYLSALDATLETFRSPRFTGLTNYVRILTDREFYDAIGFSLRYTVVVVTLEVVLGLALAIALNRELRGKRILISLLLLPLMVSPALLGIMFRLMLNEFIGTVSYYLRASGFPANLLAPPYVPYTLMVVDVIQWTPFTFLILYAGLRSIPDEPVEPAAHRWCVGAGSGLWCDVQLPRLEYGADIVEDGGRHFVRPAQVGLYPDVRTLRECLLRGGVSILSISGQQHPDLAGL